MPRSLGSALTPALEFKAQLASLNLALAGPLQIQFQHGPSSALWGFHFQQPGWPPALAKLNFEGPLALDPSLVADKGPPQRAGDPPSPSFLGHPGVPISGLTKH